VNSSLSRAKLRTKSAIRFCATVELRKTDQNSDYWKKFDLKTLSSSFLLASYEILESFGFAMKQVIFFTDFHVHALVGRVQKNPQKTSEMLKSENVKTFIAKVILAKIKLSSL
jgi:hypothetical protein